MFSRKREKSIDLNILQELNQKIVSCDHYSSKQPGVIWCKDRKGFVTVADCKVCSCGGSKK